MQLFPANTFDAYGLLLDRDDPRQGVPGVVPAANLFVIIFILVNSVLAGVAAIIGGPLLLAFTTRNRGRTGVYENLGSTPIFIQSLFCSAWRNCRGVRSIFGSNTNTRIRVDAIM